MPSKELLLLWAELLQTVLLNLLSPSVTTSTQEASQSMPTDCLPSMTRRQFQISSNMLLKKYTTALTWQTQSGWESLVTMTMEVCVSTWAGHSKSFTHGTRFQSVGSCQPSNTRSICYSRSIPQMIGLIMISQLTSSFLTATMLTLVQGMKGTTCVLKGATLMSHITVEGGLEKTVLETLQERMVCGLPRNFATAISKNCGELRWSGSRISLRSPQPIGR